MRFHRSIIFLAAMFAACAFAAERNDVRVLYDFENPAEIEELRAESDGVSLDIVQDNGVTRGKNCCRVVFKKGAEYAGFSLGKQKIKDWGNYDFIAFDVFCDREEKVPFVFELWDAQSKNYHMRCTFESNFVRQGRQTIAIPINRAKRNGKEGRSWEEAEPQDKIKMNALTRAKLFLSSAAAGSDVVWWIDNVRLMQEDALVQKMKIELPAGAKAFDFGDAGTLVPGFTAVSAGAAFNAAKGFGIASGDVRNCGKAWPDPLTGDGICSPSGAPYSFDLNLPDGEYRVWLSAGMAINPEIQNPHFLLKIGSEIVADEKPSPEELNGEKYLFRFMKTQYSERENALWLDFIDRMFPVYERSVKVSGGRLSIQAANFWLGAVIVLPADQAEAYGKMTANIRAERIRIFTGGLTLDAQKKPRKKDGDGPYLGFIPDETTHFNPATAPSESERIRKSYELAGAPGQRLTFRFGLAPFENLGKCRLTLSSLKGPAEIPESSARIYFQDYRVRGAEAVESALMPTSEIVVEKGVSWCWWVWMKIPEAAPPGDYTGAITMTPTEGKPQSFPIKLAVYPFKLEQALPLSLGMYYSPRGGPRVIAQQFEFMREVGFTAAAVSTGTVKNIKDDNSVDVTFDTSLFDLAKAAGMGKHPMQFMMGDALSPARQIGKRLGLGAEVDRNPGSEMAHPRMKACFQDFAKKYMAFIRQQGLPVAVQIVDEPREVPNPWNRNLAHTCKYGDWLSEAGVSPTFVTPMGDSQSGKDYTPLIDHTDILSTHAGKGSERLMQLTPEKKKMLWLYNTGMDRLSWGFYNWRVGSVGRWEWHFCFPDGSPTGGYLNENEWFNPFTAMDGFAPHAPTTYPGSMLFKSVFLTCSEGITDSAYLLTLEKSLSEAKGNPAKADLVSQGNQLLEKIKKSIPFLPDVKGIASADEGALVGRGLDISAAGMCETWRRQVAELIVKLKAQ